MKFLLVEHEDGGCDYTIGCGIALEEIEAESVEAAVKQITTPDHYGECASLDYWRAELGEAAHTIEKATLYVVSEVVQ